MRNLVIGPGWLRQWKPPQLPRKERPKPPAPDREQRRRVADFLRQGRVARREALKAAARHLWAS
jgi:hypothetical protein